MALPFGTYPLTESGVKGGVMGSRTDRRFAHIIRQFQIRVCQRFRRLTVIERALTTDATGTPVPDAVLEKETADRGWYYLGLVLLELDPWYSACISKFGHVVPAKHFTKGHLWPLWGDTDDTGDFFRLAALLPKARFVEILGSGEEPEPFQTGRSRIQSLGMAWKQEIENGKRYAERGSGGIIENSAFVTPALREEIESTQHRWQSGGLFEDGYTGSEEFIDSMWKVDSLSFGYETTTEPKPSPDVSPSDPKQEEPASVAEQDVVEPNSERGHSSLAEELERIQKMFNDGFLSEEQAEQAKGRLLDD